MKKQFILGLLTGFTLIIPTFLFAQPNLTAKLAGRILLQVENKGEAWYINPQTNTRFFLGRPENAFAIMKKQGLGISNKDLETIAIDKKSENPKTIVYAENKEIEYKAEIEKLKNELAVYKITNKDLILDKYANNDDYNTLLKKYKDAANKYGDLVIRFNEQNALKEKTAIAMKDYITTSRELIAELYGWWKEAINKPCYSSSSNNYDYTAELRALETNNYMERIAKGLEDINWKMQYGY